MEFKVGDTHHIIIGPTMKPYKIHIRGIIDDEMVVYKWFGRHQQWWHYAIERKQLLEIKIDRCKELT